MTPEIGPQFIEAEMEDNTIIQDNTPNETTTTLITLKKIGATK